jgi:hypothetical protein
VNGDEKDDKRIKEIKARTRETLHKITTLGYIIRAQTLVTALYVPSPPYLACLHCCVMSYVTYVGNEARLANVRLLM